MVYGLFDFLCCQQYQICWRFEGKKHDLARKLGTVIVNHQWIEECLKQGRCVSVEPYTLKR